MYERIMRNRLGEACLPWREIMLLLREYDQLANLGRQLGFTPADLVILKEATLLANLRRQCGPG